MIRMRSRHPRGVAIVMVIAILAGLMALAAPFVFSMILQSRAVRADVHAMQTRQGAQAAVAHGIAQLYSTLRFDPNDDSPEVTSLQDLKIPMEFPGAGADFDKLDVNVQNPGGSLWSVHVEDEQGKVNVNSAPPALVGNLIGSGILTDKVVKGDNTLTLDDASWAAAGEGDGKTLGTVCIEGETLRYVGASGGTITLQDALQHGHSAGALVYDGRARKIANWPHHPGGQPFASVYEIKVACAPEGIAPDDFARIERLLTICSGLDGAQWGKGAQPPDQNTQPDQFGFVIEATGGFAPETMLRVVQNGAAQAYGRVIHVHRNIANHTLSLETENSIGVNAQGAAGNFISVEPLMEHPININTAPKEVLVACFKGLCIEQHDKAITQKTAEALADFLIRGKRVYSTKDDLRKAFEAAHKADIITSPERDAVFINATEPNSPKLRTKTVPFCFHSWGSYTVEGSGVENADNGTQFARNTIRQLVTLPTPNPGRFKIQWQAGFQDLIDQGMTQRVVTFRLPIMKYRAQKDAPNLYLPDANDGNVRLDVGKSGQFNLPGEFYCPCDDLNDPGYRQDGFDMKLRDPWTLDPATNFGQNGNAVNQVACVPTSVEMWVRPLGNSPFTIYEEGLEEERNRVTFSYDPRHQPAGGLVVSIYDAGLECKDTPASFQHLKRKPVEFIYPIVLESGDWWHVAASWKTSQPNGQEIRVDAQPAPDPKDGPVINRPGVKLGGDIGIDENDTVELEEAENYDFPKDGGAIQVGEEVIEYAKRTGTKLMGLSRGARLSARAKHSSGELVTPYGYSNTLAQLLRVGGATLSEDLAAANSTHTVVVIPPNQKLKFVLDTDQSKIPVADATNFPPCGYVDCAGEVLYYDSKTATTLEKLQRAFHGPARNLHNGAGVTLCSIQISNNTQYEADGIVQIDDETNDKKVEWIGHHEKPVNNGKHFLIGPMNVRNNNGYTTGAMDTPVPSGPNWGFYDQFRNKFGIGGNTMAHSKKAKVIPVVRMTGPQCGGALGLDFMTLSPDSPYGENGVSEVSILQKGTTDGELRYVKQAYLHQNSHSDGQPCPQRKFAGWSMDFYVGLNDFVGRDFPPGVTRFLKWPSGELPDAVNAKRHILSDRNSEGRLTGHVDEILVDMHPNVYSGRLAINLDPKDLKGTDEETDIEPFNAWPQNGNVNVQMNWPTTGGVIRIEDELIFYKTAAQSSVDFYSDVGPYLKDKPPNGCKATRQWLGGCNGPEEHLNIHSRTVTHLSGMVRGIFGTTAAQHPVGAQVMLFDGMPVSCLTASMKVHEDTFTVKNGAGFPLEGYALLGNTRNGTEVVSWTAGGNGVQAMNGVAMGKIPAQNNKAAAAGGGTFSGCQYFRGRYGTTETDHDVDEVVRCLPFRYWDRDVQEYDGVGQAYIQFGYTAPKAIWDGIDMQLTGTDEQPRPNAIRPHLLVRYNHKPAWDREPTNEEGGIYEFNNKDNYVSLGGVHADEAEVRLYWHFLHGAFQPGLDWKRTFSIEKVRVRYHTPLIMRRTDEIEKR